MTRSGCFLMLLVPILDNMGQPSVLEHVLQLMSLVSQSKRPTKLCVSSSNIVQYACTCAVVGKAIAQCLLLPNKYSSEHLFVVHHSNTRQYSIRLPVGSGKQLHPCHCLSASHNAIARYHINHNTAFSFNSSRTGIRSFGTWMHMLKHEYKCSLIALQKLVDLIAFGCIMIRDCSSHESR